MLLIIQVSYVTVIKTSFYDYILQSKLTSCLRPEEKSCQRSLAKKDLATELQAWKEQNLWETVW